MVYERFRGGRAVYLCELCGFGYADQDTAERCEQLCYSKGSNCPVQSRAIYKPKIKVLE